jgi:ribosomal protein RSM22 (predicted rRNA methylase)
VTPELPPALRAALERELAGASRRGLARRAAATSAAYRGGGGSAGVIKGRDDALAYALTRLPATYAAAAAVFTEAQARAPGFEPVSLLDAGCGPGGASWAAAAAWPTISDIAWLDASAPFLELAARLAEGALPAPAVIRGDLAAGGFPRADLVVASYALAEAPAPDQARIVAALWSACGGLLALVEPGTPAGAARLLAARERLIAAGAAILAPCPHHRACPLVAPDWCHFAARLPRSRDHRLAKGAAAPFEDEKFAYILAARPGVGEAAAARVLARPRAGKPGVELKLCTGEGGLERRFVARRDRAAHAAVRRTGWGDAL